MRLSHLLGIITAVSLSPHPSYVVLGSADFAYVSVLLSDDFLLPTRVLGFALKRSNSSIPYIVYCTEDVHNGTIATLLADGIVAQRTKSISAPPSENAKQYAKFRHWSETYTKLRLWSQTEYRSLVYLDLDTLPMRDISELFHCGDFCASLRHSDMFNTGVFTLVPNITVFDDLVAKSETLASYDGADQGLLNSYFYRLKFASMFDPESGQEFNSAVFRLSSVYNYDIGMYYLNNRMLVKPRILHFTLGPTKPWIWWTYPMFDLNWKWLEIREEMELQNGSSSFALSVILREALLLVAIFALNQLFRYFSRRWGNSLSGDLESTSSRLITVCLHIIAITIAAGLTPQQMHPHSAWIFFTLNQLLLTISFNVFYIRLHGENVPIDVRRIVQFAIFYIFSLLFIWLFLAKIANFHRRCLAMFVFVVIWFVGIYVGNRWIQTAAFIRTAKSQRYKPVPN